MLCYGVEINRTNYKEKTTTQLEHCLDACTTAIEDSMAPSADLWDLQKGDIARELETLVKIELEHRKQRE